MKISDWTIGTRLHLIFTLMSALLIAVASIGIYQLSHLNENMDAGLNNHYPKTVFSNNLIVKLSDIELINRNLLLVTDRQQIEAMQKQVAADRQAIDMALEEMRKTYSTEHGKALIADILHAREQYRQNDNQFLKLRADNRINEARDLLLGPGQKLKAAYVEAIEKTVELQGNYMKRISSEGSEDYSMALRLMISLTVLSVILAIIISFFATRAIVRPMHEAVRIAQTVATGDLTGNITVHSKDETGQMMQALKEMHDSLIRIIGEVHTSTLTIATGADQIASGNMDLSSRTEEQASSLEETASSMEEMTSTVQQNADHARQANQLAVKASDVASKGGAVVAQVVHTMTEINESSRKIADIISVIDGIAFQTNILALNAAVEAARAGEQGRGFAVVATEVRNLAQRSAAAAREIKALIEDSVEKVDTGSKLVDEAGTTMEEVVASVKRVHDIMGEITSASHEQSEGIEQINQAIAEMDQVTQQNAALVEEAAAASASLQDQATALTNAVSVFKLDSRHLAKPYTLAKTAATANVGKSPEKTAPLMTPAAKLLPATGIDWEEF